MYRQTLEEKQKIFAVAPMMDWTDRHCRFFHRQMTSKTLLYTEMVVADAIIHGDRDRHLKFNEMEHPIALQIGGSNPDKLAEAVRICEPYGYDEINLNVGCPSDRVQSGTFGACLMKEPDLVGRCVAAMKEQTDTPVTVKCRLGVDDQDIETALENVALAVWEAGADALWVHARKAWLEGLSPKENRDIPPLDYNRVYRLKQDHPTRFIGINGGISSLEDTKKHFSHVDGVMMGRTAYHEPQILCDVDSFLFGEAQQINIEQVLDEMAVYIDHHVANGGRLHHITRHMTGLFAGRAGARKYRQILSSEAQRENAGSGVLKQAIASILQTV